MKFNWDELQEELTDLKTKDWFRIAYIIAMIIMVLPVGAGLAGMATTIVYLWTLIMFVGCVVVLVSLAIFDSEAADSDKEDMLNALEKAVAGNKYNLQTLLSVVGIVIAIFFINSIFITVTLCLILFSLNGAYDYLAKLKDKFNKD